MRLGVTVSLPVRSLRTNKAFLSPGEIGHRWLCGLPLSPSRGRDTSVVPVTCLGGVKRRSRNVREKSLSVRMV